MSGTPLVLVLSEDEIAAIADAAVADLAHRLAQRAFRPLGDPDGGQGTVLEGDALATLHALVHIQRAVERRTDAAAARAAHGGAGYPQLGQASNLTRQGARRRWPGLVGPARHPAPDPTAAPSPYTDRSH